MVKDSKRPSVSELKKSSNERYLKIFEKIDQLGLDYKHILGFGFGFLIISWILVVLIDIYNIFDLREYFYHGIVPTFWHYTFRESGPIEIVQWTFLALLALTSLYLYLKSKQVGSKKERNFWGLFTITGVLMLAEDWLDIRHLILREYLTLEWVVLNLLETGYFLALGLIPIGAVLLYGRIIKSKDSLTLVLIVLGIGVYLVAIFLSGPADLTNINQAIGNSLHESFNEIGGEDLEELHQIGQNRIEEQEEELGVSMMGVTYRFKDLLVEESIELIGATLLLAAAFRYVKTLNKQTRDK